MSLKLIAKTSDPPIGALILSELVSSEGKAKIPVTWSKDWKGSGNVQLFDKDGHLVGETSNDVARYLARTVDVNLYGGNEALERTEVDHWLSFSIGPLRGTQSLNESLEYLDRMLLPKTWLVAKRITIADICVFSSLSEEEGLLSDGKYPNIARWYKQIMALSAAKTALESVSKNKTAPVAKTSKPRGKAAEKETKGTQGSNTRKQEGKFIELPGAEIGKVVVRFPPEASGFLHIGHAKAALLNQYYAEAFQGQLIMRFDDTNPAKENVEFEKAILEDLEMLQIKPDRFTHSSDYFDLMLRYCDQLLKEGKAYVDDTPAQDMKDQRDQRLPSVNRNNPVDKNLKMWVEMKKGTPKGQECCVRAKIDYQSANGCMRDPTIYRCKPEPHPRTGTKYKVYPTYDFACPIVDAVEKVTHTLRTTEYHDRDVQFYWFIEALGLNRPYIWEYSRLNMTNTVLSKRRLTWFVAEGLVDGWDDPRFPTVRGILRRGMTVEGLKQFIIAQGSSRSVVFMEWDKIWSFNKKVIDPVAVRYTALNADELIPVSVQGAKNDWITVQNHPKDPSIGTKKVRVSPNILIEKVDAETLVEGQNATFINWGNLLIKKVKKEKGSIVSVEASLNLENKDFKNTVKLTWLSAQESETKDSAETKLVPCYAVYFDHIISKPVLGKDEDFKNYVAKETRKEVQVLGETELKRVKQGEIIQIQRKGFFRCDVPYSPANNFSSREQPLILFHIPDGHTASHISQSASNVVEKNTQPSKQKNDDALENQNEKIVNQGNKVRDLKNAKADKATIDAAVKTLLSLKAEYKSLAGVDWKPGPPLKSEASTPAPKMSNTNVNDLLAQIQDQENKIDEGAKKLSILKAEYKNATGQDWKPVATLPIKKVEAASNPGENLSNEIAKQGDKVRVLKSQKADKATIDSAVKELLRLKAEYKSATGQDWKPGVTPPVTEVKEVKAASNPGESLSNEIAKQGDKVRVLKSQKADKATIDPAVKELLRLKAEYKSATGQDWKPGVTPPVTEVKEVKAASNPAESLSNEIAKQGDKVRILKSQKADKATIDPAVKELLRLKAEYKSATGQDWKPGVTPPVTEVKEVKAASNPGESLSNEIAKQGDKVRILKSQKADKTTIDPEVKELLRLKAEYKTVTGQDWKPPSNTPVSTVPAPAAASDPKVTEISNEIAQQGDKVRELKSGKAEKSAIDQEVKTLLTLKEEYKKVAGHEWKPPTAPAEKKGKKGENAPKSGAKDSKGAKPSDKALKKSEKDSKEDTKTGTRLGLEAKKGENLPDWYSQVITKSEMIEYYNVSGCYILRPWSFSIWEVIRDFIDREIKKLGVENCYFPIFVCQAALEREKTHIADFAPEVAWVTKSGDSELAEPIAIRPTSETVMYPAYAKWLASHRDLPLKLNQWNNVVRWEFKHPQPFLRTREFLWQEGHTVFATKAEADEEVMTILNIYASVYEDLLAIPVVRGRKTEKEKFAGGDYTTTVEAFISASGRAIQGATSHHLGQNFSKMFDIQVEGAEEGGEKTFVYQNSWGLTTRTIGVMIMVHGDDKGLVLPPNVACIQAVVVPCGITASTTQEQRQNLMSECEKLEQELKKSGKLRIKGDYRDNYSPGWKFNHWELKGVPLRIELGPKDLEKKQVTLVRRDTAERLTKSRADAYSSVSKLLEEIHASLFKNAQEELTNHIKQAHEWADFCSHLDRKNLILAPFCGEISCEDDIKADSVREDAGDEPGAPSMGAKSLCIPFDQPKSDLTKAKCIHKSCKNKPKFYTLFGRSY